MGRKLLQFAVSSLATDVFQADEQKRMVIPFGSHTGSHRNPTHITNDGAELELRNSAARIGKIISVEPLTIDYPYGDSNKDVPTNSEDLQLHHGIWH